MHTADDDSVPVPHDAFRLPRAVLNWKTPNMGGVAARNQRGAHDSDRRPARRDAFDEMGELDEFEDEPTRMVQAYVPPAPRTPESPDPVKLALAAGQAALARGAELWRAGPLRTAATLAGVALITYLAVAGLRQGNSSGSQTILAPAAALPAAAPIVVEQLNGVQKPREMVAAPPPPREEPSDRPRTRSSGSRARETSFSAAPVSRSSSYQSVAPSRSKSRRAERSSTSASGGSAGLPAWGAEAVREFSGGSTSKSTPVSARSSQALTAKPSSSSASAPAPVAASRPTATVPVREPAKPPVPVASAKPVAPPKPAAPPPPSKPLTMDQVLNRVEDAAKEQRKKAGLHAPKTSKRDAELDELISGSMKKK